MTTDTPTAGTRRHAAGALYRPGRARRLSLLGHGLRGAAVLLAATAALVIAWVLTIR